MATTAYSQTKYIRFDTNDCRACWKCVDTCPQGIFQKVRFLWHKHAVIRQADQCTGCLKCMVVCPADAIIRIV